MNTTNTQSTNGPSKVPAVINALRRIERLLKKGWIKGRFRTSEGHCLIGAMIDAVPREEEQKAASKLLTSQVQKRVGHPFMHRYNDAFTTTKEDVLGVVRSAINVARRQYHV